MHKLDAVIAVVIVVAGIWFVRSRLKALKSYREDDAKEAAAKKTEAAAKKDDSEEKAAADAEE
jgi:hypothetical protein